MAEAIQVGSGAAVRFGGTTFQLKGPCTVRVEPAPSMTSTTLEWAESPSAQVSWFRDKKGNPVEDNLNV